MRDYRFPPDHLGARHDSPEYLAAQAAYDLAFRAADVAHMVLQVAVGTHESHPAFGHIVAAMEIASAHRARLAREAGRLYRLADLDWPDGPEGGWVSDTEGIVAARKTEDEWKAEVPAGYIAGLGRDWPHPPLAHLYHGTYRDPGLPMCRNGWNRDHGLAYSVWRGNVGRRGICAVCLKRARAGLPGVAAKELPVPAVDAH